MSAVEDRRQRAREAAYDAVAKSTGYYQTRAAIEASAEVATQVKITDEVVDVLFSAGRDSTTPRATGRAQIRLALEALGFEVIE